MTSGMAQEARGGLGLQGMGTHPPSLSSHVDPKNSNHWGPGHLTSMSLGPRAEHPSTGRR